MTTRQYVSHCTYMFLGLSNLFSIQSSNLKPQNFTLAIFIVVWKEKRVQGPFLIFYALLCNELILELIAVVSTYITFIKMVVCLPSLSLSTAQIQPHPICWNFDFCVQSKLKNKVRIPICFSLYLHCLGDYCEYEMSEKNLKT